jgi:hypothetical protein
MDNVSLYDKYHSEHNKNFIYNYITNLIKDENKVNMSENETYNQFFKINFINTFQNVDTEELNDLNKHCIYAQLDYYNKFISKQNSNIEERVNVNNNLQSDVELKEDNIVIHSIQRIINLQQSNRFSYRIKNNIIGKEYQLEKLILPIEDNYLFANPILILSLDKVKIELHLRGTMKLCHREYGLYMPFYESTFTLNSDKIHISLNNQLSHVYKGCDVYKIESINNGFIHISYKKGEFLVGDYIRICNYENINLEDDSCLKEQYKITEIEDNKIMVECTHTIISELYIMNISLQHSIQLVTFS